MKNVKNSFENRPKLRKTINKPFKMFKNRQNCPKTVIQPRKLSKNCQKNSNMSKKCKKTVKQVGKV